jgi:hypothetical protein
MANETATLAISFLVWNNLSRIGANGPYHCRYVTAQILGQATWLTQDISVPMLE